MSIDPLSNSILIFSEDTLMHSVLSIEASICGLGSRVASSSKDIEDYSICIIDLDSLPDGLSLEELYSKCGRILAIRYIQHTSDEKSTDTHKKISDEEIYKYCNFVLERPFLFEDLRRILKTLGGSEKQDLQASRVLPILDKNSMSVSYFGQTIPLSPNESRILDLLLSRLGSAVSREEISGVIGNSDSNKADVYVCYLRRKLEGASGVKLIKAVRNVGYIIE